MDHLRCHKGKVNIKKKKKKKTIREYGQYGKRKWPHTVSGQLGLNALTASSGSS
jgi:hypothetical protein